MAQKKNTLNRYRTIDKCLQNPYERLISKDLINACSEALYEYESYYFTFFIQNVNLNRK